MSALTDIEQAKQSFVAAVADAESNGSISALHEARAWLMLVPDLVHQTYDFEKVTLPFAQLLGHTDAGAALLEESVFRTTDPFTAPLVGPDATDDLRQAVHAHPTLQATDTIVVPSVSFTHMLEQAIPFYDSEDINAVQNRPVIELARQLSQATGRTIGEFDSELRGLSVDDRPSDMQATHPALDPSVGSVLLPDTDITRPLATSKNIGQTLSALVAQENMGEVAAAAVEQHRSSPTRIRWGR